MTLPCVIAHVGVEAEENGVEAGLGMVTLAACNRSSETVTQEPPVARGAFSTWPLNKMGQERSDEDLKGKHQKGGKALLP